MLHINPNAIPQRFSNRCELVESGSGDNLIDFPFDGIIVPGSLKLARVNAGIRVNSFGQAELGKPGSQILLSSDYSLSGGQITLADNLTKGDAIVLDFDTYSQVTTAPQIIVTSDPYFAQVCALLHFNESNGATTWTDIINGTGIWSVHDGTPHTTTSEHKFSTGSLDCTASTSNIAANSSAFAQSFGGGSNPWCIDTWFKTTSTAIVQSPFYLDGFAKLAVELNPSSGDAIRFRIGDNSSNGYDYYFLPSSKISTNVWHHVEIDKDASQYYFFLDGSLLGTSSVATSYSSAPGYSFRVGGDASGNNVRGYVDDFRVTAACRHTASFAPPIYQAPDHG